MLFTMLAFGPTLSTLAVILLLLLTLPLLCKRFETAQEAWTPAQEWADALEMELSVDAEWSRLADDVQPESTRFVSLGNVVECSHAHSHSAPRRSQPRTSTRRYYRTDVSDRNKLSGQVGDDVQRLRDASRRSVSWQDDALHGFVQRTRLARR